MDCEGGTVSYGPQFFSTLVYGHSAKHEGPWIEVEKTRLVRCFFFISVGNWIELESTPQSQAVRTLEYGLLNQPITAT